MKRLGIFSGFIVVVSGCGGGSSGGTPDMSAARGDMAGVSDMAAAPGSDLTASGVATGEKCGKNVDCADGRGTKQKAICIKQTGTPPNELSWPEGYCTTPCRINKNDPKTGNNSDCPGDNGTCVGSGSDGECRQQCMISADCRGGKDYACFGFAQNSFGCMPRAASLCDPQKAGSCPKKMCDSPDGGAGDGGAPKCYQDTCVNVGAGDVGACVPGCDPFANLGCPGAAGATDCHASDVTGEGLCTGAAKDGVVAGTACGNYYEDCPGGYGCFMGKCWKNCNTANAATQCSAGAKCMAFMKGMKPLDAAGTGICSMSK
jgi:hypothetical protein